MFLFVEELKFGKKYDQKFLERLKAYAISQSEIIDGFVANNFLHPLGYGNEVLPYFLLSLLHFYFNLLAFIHKIGE